jgi:hypothetical protein
MEEEDEEFGLYGTTQDFPSLIPTNEIWLAEEGREEWPIFLAGALKWIETGSYDEAVRAEQITRGGLQLGTLTDAFYLRYYRSVRDPVLDVNVWIMDGKLVRDNYKTDFVEGGHYLVYPWIPRGEIWLSDAVEEEWPFLLAHEYLELCLMRDRSMTYLDAHKKADDAEWEMRQKYLKPRVLTS